MEEGWHMEVLSKQMHMQPQCHRKSTQQRERVSLEGLAIKTPCITLGILTCPSAAPLLAINSLQGKVISWTNSATTSQLSPWDLHFCVEQKLWPKLEYGLCANTVRYEHLVEAMHKPCWLLAPLDSLISLAR